jgi:TPR repeat protein
VGKRLGVLVLKGLNKVIFTVCGFLFLTACASQQQGYQLATGKQSFISGDYKESFHTLLPLASQGVPQAEYAVGYMYYYGYGVTRDSESGTFWMQKAAQQNYKPARDALDLIHKQNVSQKLSTPGY